MDQHRDVFKVLHPTLQSWLDTFEQDCQRFSGATYLYNSLVMLGLERPPCQAMCGAACDCPDCPTCSSSGCDCLAVIADETKSIEGHEKDIRDWHASVPIPSGTKSISYSNSTYQYVLDKRDSIVKCRESIALYESMHASHADFNRRVHFLLRNVCQRGMLAKIRAVCLRDLRHAAKNNGQGRIATPSYGKELATFLNYDPQGWW